MFIIHLNIGHIAQFEVNLLPRTNMPPLIISIEFSVILIPNSGYMSHRFFDLLKYLILSQTVVISIFHSGKKAGMLNIQKGAPLMSKCMRQCKEDFKIDLTKNLAPFKRVLQRIVPHLIFLVSSTIFPEILQNSRKLFEEKQN